MELKKGITVYCGSGIGNNPEFAEAAEILGREIARRRLPLYYGGGKMGLMGAVGHSVRANGGESVAVIPGFMVERGWNDTASTHTVETRSMHERKEYFARHALGCIALPGGVGTFEELCEIITWRQLGLFSGNIVVMNIDGYYDSWLAQFHKAVEEGFFKKSHLGLFDVTDDPVEAVALASRPNDDKEIEPKFKISSKH